MATLDIFSSIEVLINVDAIRESLSKLLIDEVHMSSKVLDELGWLAIHAENSGELDSETEALAQYCSSMRAKYFCVTTKNEIKKSAAGDGLRALRLTAFDARYFRAVQDGIINSTQPADPRDAILAADITFGSSISFDNPLTFVMLRERDGYGWTTIAGSLKFVEFIKSRSTHGLYRWMDGPLPLNILGGRDPSTRFKVPNGCI